LPRRCRNQRTPPTQPPRRDAICETTFRLSTIEASSQSTTPQPRAPGRTSALADGRHRVRRTYLRVAAGAGDGSREAHRRACRDGGGRVHLDMRPRKGIQAVPIILPRGRRSSAASAAPEGRYLLGVEPDLKLVSPFFHTAPSRIQGCAATTAHEWRRLG